MKNINWEDHTLEPIDFKKTKLNINQESIQKECDTLAALLIKKNRDYGNSVQEQFEEYGLTSILIRLDDKLRRLKNLLTNPQQVADESVLDTMKDAAGYSILGSICLRIAMEKKKSIDVNKKPAYMDLDD
jgi:hypothetical protein